MVLTKYPSLYTGLSGRTGAHAQPRVIMAQNTGPGCVTIPLQPSVVKNALGQTWTSKTATHISVQVLLI
jgi:hypothetical protein